MPQGVEVWTDDGLYKVLDDNLRQYFLRASSSQATATNDVTQFGASKLVVSYTGGANSKPLCAPQLSGASFMLLTTERVSNTWTWTFVSTAAVSTSVPYLVFDIASGAGVNYGLEAWNAAGELTFASYEKPLRIRTLGIGTMSGFPFSATITGDSGRVYVGITGRFSGFVEIGLGSVFDKEALRGYGLFVSSGTTSIALSGLLHSRGPDEDPGTLTAADEEFFGEYQVALVDVTNF